MKLWSYRGKKIRITTNDDQVFEGVAHEYTPEQDNTPETESICIDYNEIYKNEIKKIELI